MALSWDYYEAGRVLRPAGVKILRVLDHGLIQRDTNYRVRRLCCDTEAVLSHAQLSKRIREKRTLCWDCGRGIRLAKQRQRERERNEKTAANAPWLPSLGLQLPLWPVPDSVRNIKFIW